MRAFRVFLPFVIALLWLVSPSFGQSRSIVTQDNTDYFGFDLRSEQNMSLDQCKTECLADQSCRAFTYNTKAKWCFLKSDYATTKPFPGAVAGKVVSLTGDPDIGAPPALAYFPAWMQDEARQLRTSLTNGSIAAGEEGLGGLGEAADAVLSAGNASAAVDALTKAVALAPDDGALWLRLSRANLALDASVITSAPQNATSAAYNAYLLLRTAPARAEALAVLAAGLDKRDMSRPALQAYEASLELEASATVQAEYEDLKARKGFRVVEHTVDSDATSPRVCAQFSEDLVKAGVDYSTFVTVDRAAPKAVSAEGKQLCVEGLEHGQHYTVAFRPGLPAAIGEVISAPVTLSVYVQDRAATARFSGESFVLPATARRGIPLTTINMDVAELKLYRVGDRSLAQLLSGYQFLRQLDGYDVETIADQMGAPVWEGQIEIAGELNKEVTTSFPIDQALPQRKPGVYVLTAQAVDDTRDNWDSRATQWFVVSEIGLSTFTGEDGLTVFARSLGTAKPLPGIELTLLARNNEILGTARTDGEGRATFTPGLTRGEGGLVPAVLTAAAGDADFVFLDMTKAGFDLSDRGVAGRNAPGAVDLYAWTERGIYRAGETVHVAALARDGAARAVENLPLTFIFTRPDGVEDRRIVSNGAAAGGYAVDFPLTRDSMRGTWTVNIHTDPKEPAIGSQMFLVEDFVPDRIEFDMTASATEITVGEAAEIAIDGRFLYGAPAAGLALEGEVTLSTRQQWDKHPGYVFGLADEEPGEATQIPLADLPLVGEDGKATFPVRIDQVPATTKLVNAGVTVRMRESGGRAVERKLDLLVRPLGPMIGLKPEFQGEVPQGGSAGFSVISVDQSGTMRAEQGLRWSLVKVDRNYQWYRSGSSWNYEPVTFTTAVAEGTLDVTAGQPGRITTPVDWGRYRLEVVSADAAGPATSYEFEAGWYVEATSTETPDALEIALDKPTYKAGDVAKLQVSPRFAGELLVTVGADRLLAVVNASVPAGGTTIDIPVAADWGAGAYVTATLFRPGEAEESRMPARAIGVKWLVVDPADKKLAVALATPAQITPRSTLSIPVSVTGAQPGSDAYAMIAAVDVGILNLTSYQAPDPEAWFFGQRRLGLELRDLYGRLIDGSLGATGRLRTGGDGAGMVAQGKPPTEKLVAFFAGPVRLDADGKTIVEFELPQFNGTVRVMAVAWTREAVGHAQSEVTVRDPIVITAGLPRFMAPGDRADMRLDIAATDAPDGDYALTVETKGGVATGEAPFPDRLQLVAGKRQTLTVPLTATEAGDAGLTIRLAGANGVTVEQVLSMTVRPAAMPVTTRQVVDLSPGASLRVDRELLAASMLDGASVSVGVSLASAFDVPSLLLALDRYPYGCAEQTTSRALPLLYVSELSAGAGMEDDPSLRGRIQEAVYGVLNYQSSSGSFGLWSPGYGDLWLDAYVSDFLTRAREQGYEVPQRAFSQAMDNLQNSIGYDADIQSRGSPIAYALYVLARNKKASVGDLRYYSDTRLEAFESPMAVAQLAASLALYGDGERSERTFQAALRLAKSKPEYDQYRIDYGSNLRDGAAILALAAESRPMPSIVPELIGYVAAERKKKQWTSTQDNAWMLLAARALQSGNAALSLSVNGQTHSGAFSARYEGNEIAGEPVVVTNTGKDRIQAVVTTVAAPVEPLPAGGNGFEITRTYYRLDGSEANVSEVTQNERFVAVINVTELNTWPSRIIITDLLPAGFEIDNPRLVSSADLSNFSWLAPTETAHLEFREDRFVAAFNQNADSGRNLYLAYVVRAVTPGIYAHPAASVEDMYRPEYSARTAMGLMQVKGL